MSRYQIAARVLAWIGIVGIIILSVIPATARPTPAQDLFGELLGHLFEHVAAFALVAAMFAIGYRYSLARLLLLVFCFCGGIELLQIPFPTRHARLSDFIINFVASGVAVIVVHVRSAKRKV
jgi:VanZ family protein